MSLRRALVGLAVWAAGCGSNAKHTTDGAVDARAHDATAPNDALPSALAVDFTVSACPDFEAGPSCTGLAPLTIEFVPLGTENVTKYLWDFGDGTPTSSESTPRHTYAFPGMYDVSLIGGAVGGSAPRVRTGFVVVSPNPAGNGCDVEPQCERGLTCVCGSMGKCATAFARGVCASLCPDGACRDTEICADLSLSALGSTTAEPWQAPLCLKPCQAVSDCPAGSTCRDLPPKAPAKAWVRACFPAYPGEIGESCRSPSGLLREELCVTGQCIDLGANGICSLDCAKAPCPAGSACAQMTDGRSVCLPTCSTFACNGDPLLACTPPNPGPLGFQVAAGAPPGPYCAPRRCMTHADCGAAGLCRDDQNGAQCTRRVE